MDSSTFGISERFLDKQCVLLEDLAYTAWSWIAVVSGADSWKRSGLPEGWSSVPKPILFVVKG